ncbi:PLP-dependent aminotransferase family protein [Nocardioides sp. W7]|uniref:aminotransferase-like domain-containing protein n=1 Tax=Nocardioides sp. W7 TaxID=2931390 RepID=UPI001FD414D8|nr:PLP-dependent aminotransferase family protein [Nocardioides sp. W7]
MADDSSARIVAGLRGWIATAAPGARLPSTRQLVAQYAASPVTVQRALRTLTGEGRIESRAGVGTFVRAARTHRTADYGWQSGALRSPHTPIDSGAAALRDVPNDVIALHSGYPDRELLPARLVRSALTRATRSEAALGRSPAAGLPQLQSWFSQELGDATPAGLTPPVPSDVIVVPGSQSGLSSIFRALLAPGQPLIMESPTYWGAILAAQQAAARIVPVPSGPAGPDPAELARAFEETGARLFYAQPNYANPTGAQWPPAVHGRILDIVRDHGAFLVEDDWAHDFAIASSAVPVAAHDDTGHVVYLRSLTKSVSPALRVAAVIARGPARDRILADRQAESMYVSDLLQAAALDVVTNPSWTTHRRQVRDQLRLRRDLLARALHDHAPLAELQHLPPGGLNLWVRLPDGTDLGRVTQHCERAGLVVAAGDEWFPAEPTGPFVRLNYAGPHPAAYPDAARILNDAIARTAH